MTAIFIQTFRTSEFKKKKTTQPTCSNFKYTWYN